METKIINWREEFTNLFPENTERKLKDNHKWCDKCNGIGFVRNGDYIKVCSTCVGSGQIELCTAGCGREKKRCFTMCEECLDRTQTEREAQREKERYDKAKKVKFADYDGMLLINERAYDKDEFEEQLYMKLEDGEEVDSYTYGTVRQSIMNIDFKDVISNACEEGYDDMEDYLDYSGVEEIQDMIDKWIEKQGNANYCYWESNDTIVLLNDLIQELKAQIEK